MADREHTLQRATLRALMGGADRSEFENVLGFVCHFCTLGLFRRVLLFDSGSTIPIAKPGQVSAICWLCTTVSVLLPLLRSERSEVAGAARSILHRVTRLSSFIVDLTSALVQRGDPEVLFPLILTCMRQLDSWETFCGKGLPGSGTIVALTNQKIITEWEIVLVEAIRRATSLPETQKRVILRLLQRKSACKALVAQMGIDINWTELGPYHRLTTVEERSDTFCFAPTTILLYSTDSLLKHVQPHHQSKPTRVTLTSFQLRL